MAKCTLDLGHPCFQKQLKNLASPAFNAGLQAAKLKIEADHESCNLVPQKMPGFPECQGKVWKYDWAPENDTSHGRKGWRMLVIVPEPNVQPYELIAGAIYDKGTTPYLSVKAMRLVYQSIVGQIETHMDRSVEVQQSIREVMGPGKKPIFLCTICGENIHASEAISTVEHAIQNHDCPGEIT